MEITIKLLSQVNAHIWVLGIHGPMIRGWALTRRSHLKVQEDLRLYYVHLTNTMWAQYCQSLCAYDVSGHSFIIMVRSCLVDLFLQDGATPLFCASYYGHKETVVLLYEQSADIEARHKVHCTCILSCNHHSGVRTLRTLMEVLAISLG